MTYSYDCRHLLASSGLKPGDKLEIMSRRGRWPRDMFAKGDLVLIVKGGPIGGTVTLKRSMGSDAEFKLEKAPKGRFKLISDPDDKGPYGGRTLTVEPRPDAPDRKIW